MSLEELGQELLTDLTEAQAEATRTIDGPLLVIAAAGSGKTRVLTRRVAYMVAQGISPGSILAITFTNKAAGEMKDRVGKVMGFPLRDFGRFENRQPTICTFHSLCMRILRLYGQQLGLSGTTVFDTSDQTKVVKDALKLLDLSTTNFPAGQVLSAISKAKNLLQTPAQYAAGASDFYLKQVAKAYAKYQSLLDAQGALDFDDLMMKTVLGFKQHPDVLAELQERFQYIMIDEYQDTNHAQYVLAHALALHHKNICVVGDPDQSIYAWRGADLRNILDFEKDYPQAKVVKLEQNYRSTKTILAVADKLIKNNVHRRDKALFTENPQGDKVQVVFCQDEHDEADVVTKELQRLSSEDHPWSTMAIFYRMNSLSRVMEDALRRANIPYIMARGTSFYERKEIKDTLAYLRVINNPLDEVALERIANTPTRGISDGTIKTLSAHAIATGTSLFNAMANAESVDALNARAKAAVVKFISQIKAWQKLAGITPRTEPTPELDNSPHPTDDDIPAPEGEGGEIEDDFAAMLAASQTTTPPPTKTTPPPTAGFSLFGEDPTPPPQPPPQSQIDNRKSQMLVPLEGPPALDPNKGPITALIEHVIKHSGLEALYAKESKGAGDTGNDPLANLGELISDAAEFDADHAHIPIPTEESEAAEAAIRAQTPFHDDDLGPPTVGTSGTLDEYLSKVALVADVDGLKNASADHGGAVTMMTLHAAKGLEFPNVAMIGLEEGVLPHSRARNNPDDLEEERRLAFVGITRAEQRLIMTKAAYRTVRGLRERTATSPFLNELPQDQLTILDRTGIPNALTSRSTHTPTHTPNTPSGKRFKEGQQVRHPTFGTGTLIELSGSGQQTRAVIEFQRAGRKTLILEYARLEPAGI